jgi:hypothetical protein
MQWQEQGLRKSFADTNRLVHDVFHHPKFDVKDFPENFDAAAEAARIDNPKPDGPPLPFAVEDGWKEYTVEIPLPHYRSKFDSEADAPTLKVPGVWLRDPIEVIKTVVKDELFFNAHLKGFCQMWKPSPDDPPQRVHDEMYGADVYRDMEDQIAELRDLNDPYENVALPFIAFSDSTNLAQFGVASLWPVYLFPAFITKYPRCRPSACLVQHIAYLPSVCLLL